MKNSLRPGLLSCSLLCVLGSLPAARAATVDLDLLVTPLTGSFHYDATVRNNGLIDLTLVSIVNAPLNDAQIAPSLTSPAGFLALYDPSAGIIDFLENTKVFGAGTTVSGFSFNSALFTPSIFTRFEAIDVNASTFKGTITVTVAPPRSVPDTGATSMLGAIALVAMGVGRRLYRDPILRA